jgi:hypothetical protein
MSDHQQLASNGNSQHRTSTPEKRPFAALMRPPLQPISKSSPLDAAAPAKPQVYPWDGAAPAKPQIYPWDGAAPAKPQIYPWDGAAPAKPQVYPREGAAPAKPQIYSGSDGTSPSQDTSSFRVFRVFRGSKKIALHP